MKKTLLFIFSLILLASCSGFHPSNLQLDGDCMVEKIVLNDTFPGRVYLKARAVEFVLPEIYSSDSMTITELAISKGATASLAAGEQLNLREPRLLRVTNGDTYIDWVLRTRNEEAEILKFTINGIYTGIINKKREILVYIPESENIKALVPTAVLSEDATISPALGVATDFSSKVTYTVTNGSAQHQYTVEVIQVDKPEALFVSSAATMAELEPEEYTACMLMLKNVPNSLYASFDDLRTGSVDISACQVIWWHFHRDDGVNNQASFETFGKAALDCKTVLQDFVNGGGSLLLTRYATHLPAYLSIGGAAATGLIVNNCWGGKENDAETTTGRWSFASDDMTHPIYQDLVDVSGNDIPMCEAGYRITNSTAQWHIGSDWGGIPTRDAFTSQTGATILGHGGDAIVAWEWKRSAQNGGILCIGSGCLDFYSVDEVYDGCHSNVDKITLNAINYLKQ